MDSYLQVKNISCQRGSRQLLNNLNFSIMPGNGLQIVGSNGVGKTTLLKIITGLLEPEAGQILWKGKPLAQNRIDYHQSLFYLSHELGIKNNLTVSENLSLDVRYKLKMSLSLQEILSEFDLIDFTSSLCSQLSQGQKQKVALAKLLCCNKKLWVLDEPFSALDIHSMDKVQHILQKHVANEGMVILTTHRPITLTSLSLQTLTLQ